MRPDACRRKPYLRCVAWALMSVAVTVGEERRRHSPHRKRSAIPVRQELRPPTATGATRDLMAREVTCATEPVRLGRGGSRPGHRSLPSPADRGFEHHEFSRRGNECPRDRPGKSGRGAVPGRHPLHSTRASQSGVLNSGAHGRRVGDALHIRAPNRNGAHRSVPATAAIRGSAEVVIGVFPARGDAEYKPSLRFPKNQNR